MRRRFLSPIQSSAWAQTDNEVPPHDEWSNWWCLELGTDQHAVCRQTHRAKLGGSSVARHHGANPTVCGIIRWQPIPFALLLYRVARLAGLLLFAWMVVRHCTPWQPRVFSWKTHSTEQTNHLVRGLLTCHEPYSIPVKDKLSIIFSYPFSMIPPDTRPILGLLRYPSFQPTLHSNNLLGNRSSNELGKRRRR